MPSRSADKLKELLRAQKPWNLDGQMRYKPVVAQLPALPLPICEVGSGPRGLASWTPRQVIGIDPGPDAPHGELSPANNFTRLPGDGANIPLPDQSVAAAVAVDTFEHIPRDQRSAVVREMKRVVRDGGRLIIIGPVGDAAARFDARVLDRWCARGATDGIVHWLSEHQEMGLPSVEEIVDYVGTDRILSIRTDGVMNVHLWWMMHRALLGDFSRSRLAFAMQSSLTPVFSQIVGRWSRGPHYRQMIVADVGARRRQ